jgi:hypothetical protein
MKKKKRKKHFLAEGILRRCGGIYVAPKLGMEFAKRSCFTGVNLGFFCFKTICRQLSNLELLCEGKIKKITPLLLNRCHKVGD